MVGSNMKISSNPRCPYNTHTYNTTLHPHYTTYSPAILLPTITLYSCNRPPNNNFNSHNFFYSLENNINEEKVRLVTTLEKIKKKNFKIVGLGASHSTTTLIYYFEIQRFLDFLIDDNEKKHNTYSPGFHIKVYDKKYLEIHDIKYLIILAWQHEQTIIKKYEKFLQKGGTILIPLPKFKIIKLI